MLLELILGKTTEWVLGGAIKAAKPIVNAVVNQVGPLLQEAKEGAKEKIRDIVTPNLIIDITQQIMEHMLRQVVINERQLFQILGEKLKIANIDPITKDIYQRGQKLLQHLEAVDKKERLQELPQSELRKYTLKIMLVLEHGLRKTPLHYYEQLPDLALEKHLKGKLVESLAEMLFQQIAKLQIDNPHTFYSTLLEQIDQQVKLILNNSNYNEKLLSAAKSKKADASSKVAYYLALGANANAIDRATHASALLFAVNEGNEASLRMLLESGANPNYCSDLGHWRGWSALGIALEKGYGHLVQPLLEAGADPNHMLDTLDEWRAWTPLCMAVHNRHKKLAQYTTIIDLLLKFNADPNHRIKGSAGQWNGWTPLMLALRNFHQHQAQAQLTCVNLLLDYEANPNHCIVPHIEADWYGWTPLAMTIHNYSNTISNNVKICELLLEQSANTNHKLHKNTWKGWTPLGLAIRNYHQQSSAKQEDLIKLLLKFGADTSLTTCCGDNKKRLPIELARSIKSPTIALFAQIETKEPLPTIECSALENLNPLALNTKVLPKDLTKSILPFFSAIEKSQASQLNNQNNNHANVEELGIEPNKNKLEENKVEAEDSANTFACVIS